MSETKFLLPLNLQHFAAPYKRNGITAQTVDHFVIDAGAVYLNLGSTDPLKPERLLGATSGGNTFTIEQDVRDPEIDGLPGSLKGARRIVTVRPKLEINLIEITRENILLALAGADSTAYPDPTATTHDSIKRRRNITAADYVDNISLVGTVSGSDEPIIIIVENALQDDNFEIGGEDQKEGVIKLTFTGHYDPADLTAEPWEIRFPKNNGLQSGITV